MSDSFDNVVFPLAVDYLISSVKYLTEIYTDGSGNETRVSKWDDGRARFNAVPGVRTIPDIQRLRSFFRGCKGMGRSFLVYDPLDCKQSDDGSRATFGQYATGTSVYQLEKTYTNGANNDNRIINKPKPGTIQIWVGGVLKTEGVHYTIDYLTGEVTFLIAQTNGAVLEWKGQHYVCVRFDVDELPADQVFYNYLRTTEEGGFGPIPEVPMIEVFNE
jgi:uncharacterized protein (TIGR02217 family)